MQTHRSAPTGLPLRYCFTRKAPLINLGNRVSRVRFRVSIFELFSSSFLYKHFTVLLYFIKDSSSGAMTMNALTFPIFNINIPVEPVISFSSLNWPYLEAKV